jgi:hypothetical protein
VLYFLLSRRLLPPPYLPASLNSTVDLIEFGVAAADRTWISERVRNVQSHIQASLTESVNSSLRHAESRAMTTCGAGTIFAQRPQKKENEQVDAMGSGRRDSKQLQNKDDKGGTSPAAAEHILMPTALWAR